MRCLVILAALGAVACAPAKPATPPPDVAAVPPQPPEAHAEPPRKVEATNVYYYVMVEASFTAPYVKATDEEIEAWAAANTKSVLPVFRHILIKATRPDEMDAARKRGLAVLARLKRGASFADVAKELSEDPGSRDKGGAYPGTTVATFVEPVRKAYDALAPGETTKSLVESSFGVHIVRKDKVAPSDKAEAYRQAHGLELARRVAEDIAARVKRSRTPTEAALEAAIEPSITTLTGASVTKSDAYPVFGARVTRRLIQGPLRDGACTRALATPLGEVATVALDNEEGFAVVFARAETESEARDPALVATDEGKVVTDLLGLCEPGLPRSLARQMLQGGP